MNLTTKGLLRRAARYLRYYSDLSTIKVDKAFISTCMAMAEDLETLAKLKPPHEVKSIISSLEREVSILRTMDYQLLHNYGVLLQVIKERSDVDFRAHNDLMTRADREAKRRCGKGRLNLD